MKNDNQCLFALYSGVKPVFLNALVMHFCRNIQSFSLFMNTTLTVIITLVYSVLHPSLVNNSITISRGKWRGRENAKMLRYTKSEACEGEKPDRLLEAMCRVTEGFYKILKTVHAATQT